MQEIVGKKFIVRSCEARAHGDNDGCLCSLIGKEVIITKKYNAVLVGTDSYHIRGSNKRVRLSELDISTATEVHTSKVKAHKALYFACDLCLHEQFYRYTLEPTEIDGVRVFADNIDCEKCGHTNTVFEECV